MTRPPFRVAQIEIRDLRGVERLSLDLRDGFDRPLPVAVLIGPNGSGKTTTLEAILMALDRHDLLPDDRASVTDQARFGADDFNIGLTLADRDGGNPTALSVDQLACSGEFDVMPGLPYSTHREALRRIDLQVAYLPSRREPEALGERPDPRGARSRREARRLHEAKRALVSLYYRSLRSKVAMGPESPFLRLQSFWQRFAEDDRVLDVIPASSNPADGDEVVLREARSIPEDVTTYAQARVLASTRPDIPRLVPLDRLSDGQLAAFRFAATLLFQDRPLDLLLIDEPEQHLHPRWHHRLLPALQELAPDTQIVVATHAPEIVSSVRSFERFSLGDPMALVPEVSVAAE